jgi:aminoglycoside phosphotransferase (APT) family kinase protein
LLPGSRLGFLDWQVVRRGDHVLDLGYVLQGALTVDDRRRHEVELVEEHHQHLDVTARPSLDEICPEASAELSLAYVTAFVDLETPGAIAQLAR